MSDWLDAESHADRALEMYERGRWAEAEAELRKAISLNPDQAEWHFNLGLTLEAAGRDADALASFERAVELMPEQADPLVAAGAVANRLGRHDRALQWLDRALRLEPHLEAAYAHTIESNVRLGRHYEAETTFYLAQQALLEPSAHCLAMMAESLIQRSLFDRAEWCLKEALRLEPNMPRLRARLAGVSASTGRPERALQLFLRELRDDPGSVDTLLEYGELLMELGRLPESAEKFRRVLELEPANVHAHFGLGNVALRSQRCEQAHLEFELVLKLDGQYPGIRRSIGEALLRRGRMDEARSFLIEEHESTLASLNAQPPRLAGQSTTEKASTIEESTTASAAESMSSALTGLADLLLEVEEPARAAQLLNAAIADGENADVLRQLALARFRSGDDDGGAAASRRVLRLQPDCLRSIHNLALAALRQRRLRIAAGWIDRGLRINRNDDGLRRLRIRVWLASFKQFLKAPLTSNRLLAMQIAIIDRIRSIQRRSR